jgi:hypothetical protein
MGIDAPRPSKNEAIGSQAMKRIFNETESWSIREVFSSALLLGLAALVCLAFAIEASAEKGQEAAIDRLLVQSGMTHMIESFARSASEQMALLNVEFENEDQRYVQEIFQAVFAAPVIRKHVNEAVAASYNPAYAAELEGWFGSELGSKFRDAEIYAQSLDATGELLQFAQASQTQPPNPERLAIAENINEARGASDLSFRLVSEMLRGILTGTANVSMVEGQAPTAADIEAVVQAQTEPHVALLEQQMIVSFLFIGRNFSLADNRAYLKHIDSDAGKWFYARSGDGLVSAMVLAGRAFGSYSSSWVQDMRGAASPESTEERRAKAAEAGRIYANGQSQAACVDNVYEQRKACKEDACFLDASLFAQACLMAAKPAANFCKGVPGTSDDLGNWIYWRLSRCDARETPDVYCDAAMGAVQQYCAVKAAS